MRGAHRVSYWLATDVKLRFIQDIHHKCANKLCVNPSHLEIVDRAQNNGEMLERRWYRGRIDYLEGLLNAAGIEFESD